MSVGVRPAGPPPASAGLAGVCMKRARQRAIPGAAAPQAAGEAVCTATIIRVPGAHPSAAISTTPMETIAPAIRRTPRLVTECPPSSFPSRWRAGGRSAAARGYPS